MKQTRYILIFFLTVICLLNSCSTMPGNALLLDRQPDLKPNYSGVTIPVNIAPLNFRIQEKAENYLIRFEPATGSAFVVSSSNGTIQIPEKKWKNLLQSSVGQSIRVNVFAKTAGKWTRYQPIENFVSPDSIDSHLVYRLIEPGFVSWGDMGIYQRNLENFDEIPVIENSMSDNNCMNCHSFNHNDASTMLFHMRGAHGGTIIFQNGNVQKFNTATDSTLSAGVYPAWHPNGRLIAFSTNKILQRFHAVANKRIEVQDTISDIVLLDTRSGEISTDNTIATKNRMETFPTWSPDGLFLYFCSATRVAPSDYSHIHYDLLRCPFNPETQTFGTADTIFAASKIGKSVSFPRVSPDGMYLLFCLAEYGNFSIWHDDADLLLLNLSNGEISRPDINSDKSESYHSWSSSGRWIVFSSRRSDGLFTRPYLAYFDRNGTVHKPFVLPQKDPDFYDLFLKSYNLPELVTSEIRLNPRKLLPMVRAEATLVTFRTK